MWSVERGLELNCQFVFGGREMIGEAEGEGMEKRKNEEGRNKERKKRKEMR